MRTLMVLVLVAGCAPGAEGPATGTDREGGPIDIVVESPAFGEGETIPERFTCEGEDLSPPLAWSGLPEETVSVAVVVDDPDAPRSTFVHWVVWGIDPGVSGLEAGSVPGGAQQARNDFGPAGYGGPCPPPGDEPHRYRFRVLALDRDPRIAGGVGAAQAVPALEGTTLAEGVLMARFGR